MNKKNFKVSVIGAGSWGTAVANILADNGIDVFLWGRDKEVVNNINNFNENKKIDSPILKNGNIDEKVIKEKEDIKTDSSGKLKFKALIDKIYDRNYDLGKTFEKCVKFVSYENGILTWESSADDSEKYILREGWGIIKLFVQEIFGIDTTIKPIQKKKSKEDVKNNDVKNSNIKKIEEPQNNSCIMPSPTDKASQDTDPNNLLKEPLIEELIKYFEPKRVVIKQKS